MPYLGVDPNADPTDEDVLKLPDSFFNYDISGYKAGHPMGDEIVYFYLFVRNCTFSQNFIGSLAKTLVAPTNNLIFSIQKNGVSIGTIYFPAGTVNAQFASSSSIAFNTGDLLTIVAPSVTDISFYSFFFTLKSSLY
jgi:hypothetical protein